MRKSPVGKTSRIGQFAMEVAELRRKLRDTTKRCSKLFHENRSMRAKLNDLESLHDRIAYGSGLVRDRRVDSNRRDAGTGQGS